MFLKIEKYKMTMWGMVSFLLLFPLYKINAEDVIVTGKLKNPLGTTDTVPALITKILTDIVNPIGAVVIVFFIIYAGFLFVKAKKILFYVVIGAAVILGANLIAVAIQGTIGALK